MTTILKLHELTLKWSADRGILANGNTKTQVLKLGSEIGELCLSVYNGNDPKDDIGDCMVLLTNICHLEGIIMPLHGHSLDSQPDTFPRSLDPRRLSLGVSAIFGEVCDRLAKDTDFGDLVPHMLANLRQVANVYGHTIGECWAHAYNEIKDRRGFLNASGNFIKESDPRYEQLLMEFHAMQEGV